MPPKPGFGSAVAVLMRAILSVTSCSYPNNDRRLRLPLLAASIVLTLQLAFPLDSSKAGDNRIRLKVTTPLEHARTPLDPVIDFGELIKQQGSDGRFDPNSVEVWNAATNQRVRHAMGEGFAYGDRGRVQWVIEDPAHTEYVIHFSTRAQRAPLRPAASTPAIGVGDLLRYNAGEPRPVTLFYSAGLHDLTGDGHADLVGTWNYAYRPGWPWSGIVCYPRVAAATRDHGELATTEVGGYDFGDLTRLRKFDEPGSAEPTFFEGIYMSADMADFDGDGRLDLVCTRQGASPAAIWLQTNERDPGGLPLFTEGASVAIHKWEACRAVDLNGDGKQDLVVDGTYVRNVSATGWPFEAAPAVQLDAGRQPCFLDVDADGRQGQRRQRHAERSLQIRGRVSQDRRRDAQSRQATADGSGRRQPPVRLSGNS